MAFEEGDIIDYKLGEYLLLKGQVVDITWEIPPGSTKQEKVYHIHWDNDKIEKWVDDGDLQLCKMYNRDKRLKLLGI